MASMGRPAEDLIIETEALFAGRLAFILGRRSKGHSGYDAVARDATNAVVPFRQASQLAAFAVGGSDVNTMQRMCSFEYLSRYFYHVLRDKIITVGGVNAPGTDHDFPDTWINNDLLLARQRIIGRGSMTSVNGSEILTAISENSHNQSVLTGATGLANLENSGIYLADPGPFLRGKTLETQVFKIGNNRAILPASIGDVVAFSRLQELIASSGACDWVPDGIVHSKLSQGDQILDQELDSRDGQLYNVTVGGPAIASSWTNDKYLEVMPLDKVFVVIVADVWHLTAGAKTKAQVEGDRARAAEAGAYEQALITQMNHVPDVRTPALEKAYFDAGDKQAVITNMRVRLTTSSEMVGCSALKTGKHNRPPPHPLQVGANAVETTAVRAAALKTYFGDSYRDRHSRMGLALGGDGGASEYIIGGWCIGTVLDSAASRASMAGGTLVGAVKRQRISHASNVKVGVEWWSADRMYRSFMNVKSGIRTRYTIENSNVVHNNHTDATLSKALSRPVVP